MNVNTFKIIVLVILSVLLFISLGVLAGGIAIDRTILNARFINVGIEKIDLPAVIEEMIISEPGVEIPIDIGNALIKVAASSEGEIKTRIGRAVNELYDYIKGEENQLNLADLLRRSILVDEILYAFIDELNIISPLQEISQEMIDKYAPGELKVFADLPSIIEKTVQGNELLVKNQLKNVIGGIAEYLTGGQDSSSAKIDMSPLIDDLGQSLQDIFVASPPKYLEGSNEQQVIAEFNRLFEQFASSVPVDIDINEEILGSDFKTEFVQTITDGEIFLGEARHAASVFKTGFIASIAAVFVLTIIIMLVHRNTPGTLLNLGIVFAGCGLIVLASAIICMSLIPQQVFAPYEAQSAFTNWSLTLIRSVFDPGIITGIVYSMMGAAMCAVCFLLRRQERY
jgi:hypothetical protein